MAIRLRSKQNTHAPNGEYPYGDIKDNTGINDGTPFNREVYADIHQFFARMMEKAIENAKDGFDWNETPDNAYDGFQYFEALLRTKPYKYYSALLTQSGSNAPTIVVLENTIGTLVASYSGAGEYALTLSGAFPADKTWCIISNGLSGTSGGEIVTCGRVNNNSIAVRSFDNANAPANGILISTAIEIRVYP